MEGLDRLLRSGVSIWLDPDPASAPSDRDVCSWIRRGIVTGLGPTPAPTPLQAARWARWLRGDHGRSGGADGLVHVRQGAGGLAAAAAANAVPTLPLTPAGLDALERLVHAGRSAAIAPVLSAADARAAAECHLRGLERRVADGAPLAGVVSLAWCPVGTVDAYADAALDAAPELRGWLGAAVAQIAYAETYRVLSGVRWERLASAGALRQRAAFRPSCAAGADPLSRLALPDAVVALPPAAIERLCGVAPSAEPDETEAGWIVAQARRAGVDLSRLARPPLNMPAAAPRR